MRGIAILVILRLAGAALCSAQGIVTTVAGTSWVFRDNQRLATQAALGRMSDVLVSSQGNIYAADQDNHIVVRVDTAGIVSVIAGNGLPGFSGEGGLANKASLKGPAGLWLDTVSNLYIADADNHRIRRVNLGNGILTTIVGTGTAGFSGDGGLATSARINFSTQGEPRRGMVVDAAGNLYFSDTGNNRVRKVDTGGVITTVAGTGVAGFSGDGGPATAAALNQPAGLFRDRNGNLYVADRENYRIRRFTPGGPITTVAGNGQRAFCGDGGPALSACLSEVSGIYVDGSGQLLIADPNNQRIRFVNSSGVMSTTAGSGILGFSGDGGPAREARMQFPSAVFLDPNANLVIADTYGRRIRRVERGIINTVAGNDQFKFAGDGGPATSANLNIPYGTALDPDGALYIAEAESRRVRKLSPDGTLTTIAGNGIGTTSGDNGPAVAASFRQPVSLAHDSGGNLYVADLAAQRIRRINPQGIITTFAGTGTGGFSGDGGPAANATLNFLEGSAYPTGVAADTAGNVYIADSANQRIRKVNPAGIISTYAGNGLAGFSGDNGPATAASLNSPTGVAVDSSGSLYIADRENHRIRRVSSSGIISTVAGNGSKSFSGEGGPATSASLNKPVAVAFDGSGGFYIADSFNLRIRQVSAAGIIRTVAGRGTTGFAGDGGPATSASFALPFGVTVDAAGNLYIADATNDRIRKVLAAPPAFSVSPSSLRFSVVAGSPAVAQRLSVSGTVTGLGWTATASTNSGGSWLTLSPSTGGVPGTLNVGVNPASLAAGAYRGTVTVQAPLSSTPSQFVTVDLEVTSAGSPKLVVEPAALSFENTGGSAPAPQTIRISNSGTGSLQWTARATTASGGTWLAVATAAGSASAGSAASVQVQVTSVASSLAPGVYSGTVQVDSSGTTQAVKVTLLRGVAGQTILVSQNALQFTGVEGGSIAPPQTFGVLNTGQGAMDWAVEASTLSGGAWLSVSPTSGTSTANSLQIPELEVSVKVAGLRTGQYNGLIKISASGANNSPQFITVDLNVLPTGSNPGVVVQPTGLIFAARAGASAPSSKTIRLAKPAPGSVEVRGGLLTFDGEDWLETLPRNLVLSASEARTLTVQPNLKSLAPGIYRAALTLLLADGSPSQVVNVLFAVVGPGTSSDSGSAASPAADCSPQQLFGLHSSLGNGFQARVGSPTSVQVELIDDCGNPAPYATVVAAFSNGDAPLALVSLGDGSYSGTWRPSTAAAQATVTVRASLAPLQPLEIAANGQVSDNPLAPALFAGGIVHAASFAAGEALAPGSIISAFGRKLAQADAASAIPLPKTLGTTTVTIGGLDAPLFFTSEGQVNLQVPFELAPNTRPQVVVKTRPSGAAAELFAVPETITIAAARPGIFTTNQGGTGQGVILLNDRLADSANPARAGDVVVVYCTGLGVTQPAVASGVASPGSPPGVTTAPVTATVGGVPAIVDFAGLTPGFVGLYQVNLRIPSGVTPNGAVPLVLTQDGVSSNTVTLAVR